MKLTDVELSKYAAQIAAEGAQAELSLAKCIEAARTRHLAGETPPRSMMDSATRPKDRKGAEFWERLQAAKARTIAFDAHRRITPQKSAVLDCEQMSDAEIEARIATLRAKTGSTH